MPDEYRDYVGTANSFSMNQFLYSGRYADIKSGRVSPGNWDEIKINQIEAFKDYIDKAPNLHKNTKLVRLVDGDAFEGILVSAIGKSSVGFIPDNIRDAMLGTGDKKAAAQEFTARVAGVRFEANSFISASYDDKRNVFKDRDYQLEIYADKGVNALMTYNHRESEVVLNVGSRLEFMDVEIKGDKVVVKMRAHSRDKKFTD